MGGCQVGSIHLGNGSEPTYAAAEGLVNIAALLAQCMWESGGEAPFTACGAQRREAHTHPTHLVIT
jgi:hypothetical protein